MGDVAAGAARVMAFFGIAFLVTALFVYAYTRSLRLTAVPLACSLIAVVWQLGAVTGLGFGIDPMSILVPFLVFAIGVSHGVQMVSAVRAEVIGGASAPGRGAGELPPPAAAGLGGAGLGLRGLHHHLADRGAGHPGDRAYRQHRRGRDHPHQSGAAAGAALVSRSERRGAPRAASDLEPPASPAVVAPRAGGAAWAGGAAAIGVAVVLAAAGGALRGAGPGRRRAATACRSCARGLRVQPGHRRHRRTLRDRSGRADGDRGDGARGLHRLRGDEYPRRLRMARAQRRRCAVGARARGRGPRGQRRLERGQPQVAGAAAQPLHAGAVGIPGAHRQRPAQHRLQRDAGADLHRRPQGRDHRAHRRSGEGVPGREPRRAHRLPARRRQRGGDGGDQRGGRGVPSSPFSATSTPR